MRYVHDGEREQDEDKLASAFPGREDLAEETASAAVREGVDIGGVSDGHKRSAEDLDKADGDEETKERQNEDAHAGCVGRETAVVVRRDGCPLEANVSCKANGARTKSLTPVKEPNTMPPKLSTSAERLRPVSSSGFWALASKPACPPRPQRKSMTMEMIIQAYRSYTCTRSYPTKQGIKLQSPTMMMPTTSGSVPGLMAASVCPPRMTAVTEKPSLTDCETLRYVAPLGYSLCQDVQDGVNGAADVT